LGVTVTKTDEKYITLAFHLLQAKKAVEKTDRGIGKDVGKLFDKVMDEWIDENKKQGVV